MQSIQICPSILAADFAHLGREAERMRQAGADMLHVDVMDGHFVPNLSLGIPVLQSLRKATNMVLDVHLMISSPMRYLAAFAEAGADRLTVHVEADDDPADCIREIRRLGKKAALSVKPGTPIEAIQRYLPRLDSVLVMTVEPGFGGQVFMAAMLDKISQLHALCPRLPIQVDGGINPQTAARAVRAGATMLVAGSSIFGAGDPAAVIRQLREL